MIRDAYYYNQMDERSRTAYNRTREAILNHKSKINIMDLRLTSKEYLDILQKLLLDDISLYYVNAKKIQFISVLSQITYVVLSYTYTQAECSKYDELIEKRVTEFIERANLYGKNNSEVVHSLHDLFVLTIKYDYSADTGTSDSDLFAHSILGVFLKRKAVCDGVAKAFKYLLNRLNIRCVVVRGILGGNGAVNGKENHAWNIVYINDDFYHIDVTNDLMKEHSRYLCQDYYCLDDKLISRDHRGFQGVPRCTERKENYFDKNGTAISGKESLRKLIDSKCHSIPGAIYCRIDYDEQMKSVVEWIQNYIVRKFQGTRNGFITIQNIVNQDARTIMFFYKINT